MDRALLMVATGTGIVLAFLITLLSGDLKTGLGGNLVAGVVGAVAGWAVARPPMFNPMPGSAAPLSIVLAAIGAALIIALHRLT